MTIPAGGAVEIVSVDDAFDDPDDFRLRYTASSSNSAAATVVVIGADVLIDPLSVGTATIAVTVTDPWSATASTTFDADVQTPTLQTPTLSISGNLFTFGFTDDFAANETRAYQIRIRRKAPIEPWATGCYTETNDENSQQSITVTLQSLVSDFFFPGNTYEADYGYLGSDCGDSLTGLRSATAEATVDGTFSFDIDLVFVGSISSRYRSASETAARRWERIIADDIPNHRLSSNGRSLLNRLYPGATVPDIVDDLVVYMEIVEIDGEGGILGKAGRLLWRIPSSLPIASYIELDRDDIGTMSNARLQALILHEIGHTLGFIRHTWRDLNLLRNPSLDENNDPIVSLARHAFLRRKCDCGFQCRWRVELYGRQGTSGERPGRIGQPGFSLAEIRVPQRTHDAYTRQSCSTQRDHDPVAGRYRLPRQCQTGRCLHPAFDYVFQCKGSRGSPDQLYDHSASRRRARQARAYYPGSKEDDGKLIVRWDAVPDEEGKPPVTGRI